MKIVNTRDAAEIALCNLGSLNLKTYQNMDDQERDECISMLVRALDNTIDLAFYPVRDSEVTNKNYRYLGIGVMNMANALAERKMKIDSHAALEYQDEMFDDISYRAYSASIDLGQERGVYPKFNESKWKEGLTPVHMSRRHFPETWNLTEYGRNFNMQRWNELGAKISKLGLRNAQLLAIAPTANSGKAINATESTEPVADLFYKEEGKQNVMALAPNFTENNAYYTRSFDCDQMQLIKNAAIRQKYLDQTQSVTLYLKDTSSLKLLTDLHLTGFKLGLKTFYYLKQQKNLVDNECEACAV